MNSNPVANCTLIIRSQAEYSVATQRIVVRCLLEKSTTGQRRGFTDVDTLLIALRAELLELQNQIIPPDSPNLKSAVESGSPLAIPDHALLSNDDLPTESGAACGPKDTPN